MDGDCGGGVLVDSSGLIFRGSGYQGEENTDCKSSITTARNTTTGNTYILYLCDIALMIMFGTESYLSEIVSTYAYKSMFKRVEKV